MCFWKSCKKIIRSAQKGLRYDRLANPDLQRGAAILEGRVSDDWWPSAQCHVVSADIRPCLARPCEGVRQRELHRLFSAWLGDDESAAKRFCQQLVFADYQQDDGQSGVSDAVAFVPPRLVHCLCRRGDGARPCGSAGRAGDSGFFRADQRGAAGVDAGFCAHGVSANGCSGFDWGPLGGEIRPARGVSEFRHHADDVSEWRFLFDPLAASGVAMGQPYQPFLLHD